MSLSDIYTLSVRLQADTSSLRSELAAAQALLDGLAKSASSALGGSATAMERSAQGMESGARRTGRATQQTRQETQKTADAFAEYQKRAQRANDEVARSSEQSSQRTTQSLGGIGRALGRLTGVAGLAMLGKQVWDTGRGFHEFTQNTQVALELFLGSQEAAKGFLADVLEFAKQTPYAFTDLTEQAQRLITYGFEAKEVVPILRAVGDAASSMGMGVAGIDRITRAIGQINTKGRLQSQELLQLSEAGVNGLAILANQAGVTTIEYQKLIEQGMIPAEEAIAGLTRGIRDGTDGVNGATVAFGGFMERIKGAGGITATLDATRTSFRNSSAALTESLIPSYIELMRTAQGSMGILQNVAGVFNGLPQPVRQGAIALALAGTAMRLLNVEARAAGAWVAIRQAVTNYRSAVATARVQTEIMTASMSRSQAALYRARTGMVAATGAMRGLSAAFGGPVGLAITGAVAGLVALSSASAEARQETSDFADSLDQVTGALTDQSTELVKNALLKEHNFGVGNNQTLIAAAEKMGVSIETLTAAWLGEAEAIKEVRRASEEYEAGASIREQITLARASEAQALNRYLDGQLKRLEDAKRITEEKRRVDEAATESLKGQGEAIRDANEHLRQFTEEQQTAIDKAQENAAKAVSANLANLNLNIASADDVADALLAVTQRERELRDAQEARHAVAGKEKATANEIIRADERVADAHKALQDSLDQLGATEDRTDPVKQYKDKVNGIIEANETFLSDLQTLADRGLNATDLQELFNAGAEGSLDTRRALLGDDDMVEFANQAREALTQQAETIRAQASVVELHLQDTGNELMGEIGLGMRLAAQQNSSDTLLELAARLGEKASTIRTVGNALGLEFVNGFRDSLRFDIDAKFNPRPTGGSRITPRPYALGGIYPGYTPGRDIGFIGVSGGEAIMRPEFTRAVGPDLIHRWNHIARSSGVDGVRQEMRRYLGGFANGGIAAAGPQVVTVPVESTNQHYSPINMPNATIVAADLDDFRRQSLQHRRRSNIGGFRD